MVARDRKHCSRFPVPNVCPMVCSLSNYSFSVLIGSLNTLHLAAFPLRGLNALLRNNNNHLMAEFAIYFTNNGF